MSNTSTVRFKTVDNEIIKIKRELLKVSNVLKGFKNATEDDQPVTLANLRADILRKIVSWIEQHKDDSPVEDDDEDSDKQSGEITSWDKDFLNVDHQVIFELILAANYLEIKGLVNLCCNTIGNMFKGKKADESGEMVLI